MANEITAKNVGIYYNSGTTEVPVWLLMVCSTSDGFSGSTDAVTTSTKCDDGWVSSLPGDKSWSFSHSALASSVPGSGQMSFKEIEDLWIAGTIGEFKMESTEAADDYYWFGTGWISELNEEAPSGEYVTVDITITGTGTPANVEST